MGAVQLLKSAGKYPTYVLVVLMLVYLVNQMDRFVLGVTSRPMARDIHFGNQLCELSTGSKSAVCEAANDTDSCNATVVYDNTTGNSSSNDSVRCAWVYTGTGKEYDALAGSVFIGVFSTFGVLLGPLADWKKTNRRMWLAVAVSMWSLMNILTSFATAYWHLVMTRLGLGLFEAICTPFAVSLINGYFDKSLQGTALGVYNLGIYIGYSLSFALKLLVSSVGWRWVYRISGFPGVGLGLLMMLSVKEPPRVKFAPRPSDTTTDTVDTSKPKRTSRQKLARALKLVKEMLWELWRFEVIIVALTSSIRFAGGYVLAYHVNEYFAEHDVNVAYYMSWVPLVGGLLSATIGGFLSDVLSKKYGLQGRLLLLIASQALAAPFAFGVVYLPNPNMAFISLLVTYTFGETYLGVAIAIVTTIVSPRAHTFSVAMFLFVISNIGGNTLLLVAPLSNSLSSGLKGTLTILYCSGYIAAALGFFITLMRLRRSQTLHSPTPLLEVDVSDTEDFDELTGPMYNDDDDETSSADDDKRARAPLISTRMRSQGSLNKRVSLKTQRSLTLSEVDDQDMAHCASMAQAMAVNWQRSFNDDDEEEMLPRIAASAPADIQNARYGTSSPTTMMNPSYSGVTDSDD